MAMKIKLMRLLEEVRGHAQITNRRPVPRQPMLYLMQLRERTVQAQSPKRRFAVTTDFNESDKIALPIKINHVNADPADILMVLR